VRIESGPQHPLDDGLQMMGHTHLLTGESRKGIPPSCIKKMANRWETLTNIESTPN
jgi:hypothetical protein